MQTVDEFASGDVRFDLLIEMVSKTKSFISSLNEVPVEVQKTPASVCV